MPAIVYLSPQDRGTPVPTGHDDDSYSAESTIVPIILPPGYSGPRKSRRNEVVGGFAYSSLVDVIDGCFLRESEAMATYFEYSDEWCDATLADCGTALGCFKSHREPIPVTSLRPQLDS